MSASHGESKNIPAVDSGAQAGDLRSAIQDVDADKWERIAEIKSAADLFGSHRGAPVAAYLRQGDGAMAIRGADGGVSRTSARARAGDVFRATTTLVTEGEGETAPAHFGPMFFNARDEVILNPRAIPVKAFGEELKVDVQSVAPEGAVTVRLRMVGTWEKGRDTSGIVCTYGPAALYRAKA